MSRGYGQYATSMWDRGSDFRELTRSSQGTYFMLGLQRDISAVGLLIIPVSMWSDLSCDPGDETVRQDLQLLAERRFIVMDGDELLIRGFIRSDRGYTNELRRKSIVRAAHDVQSPILRAVLAVELARVGIVIPGFDTASHAVSGGSDAVSGARSVESGNMLADASFDTASDQAMNAGSMPPGVVGTNGEWLEATIHTPQPPNPEPLRPGDFDELSLIAEIRALRPGWAKPPIRNAIRRALDLGYDMPHVAAAFRVVADDPATKKPGRLAAPGPWWDATAPKPAAAGGSETYPTHPFDPQPDDPDICRCNAPRRNRRHTFAEGPET